MTSTTALLLVVTLLSSQARAANESPAVCQSEFSWMENEKEHNPCLVAAVVQGACDANKWTVPALDPKHSSYAPPGYDSTKANQCSCSWAAYNLISACTVCQGYPSFIKNWANITDTFGPCKAFLGGNTYFPSSVPLENEESIPSWAGMNPTNWRDGRFNVDQAKSEADKNKPDLRPWENKSESKTPVGAIAGGVVGGVVVIGLGAFLAWFFFFRRNPPRQGSSESLSSGYDEQNRPPHGRSFSDLSGKSWNRGMSYISSPTLRSGSSTHSIGTHFGSIAQPSVYNQPNNPPQNQRTRPGPSPHQPNLSREEMISPFTLTSNQVSPTPPSNAHRKMNSDVSDISNASIPVSRMSEYDEEQIRMMALSPASSRRGRFNPPAYTQESPTSSTPHLGSPVRREPATPGHGRGLRHQRSQESALSWEGNAGRTLPTIRGSISSLREITGGRGPGGDKNIPIA